MVVNVCRLLEHCPIKRLLFFSSAAVYGEDVHNTQITEETPVYPTSYYGMSKFISERLLWKIFEAYDSSSLLILRPPTIFGPGDEGDTYGPVRYSNAAAKKTQLTLWGDGTELREFIYINDIVDIVCKLTYNSFDGVLNVASGVSYSFVDVLNAVEEVSGTKVKINKRKRTKRKVDNIFINKKISEVIKDYTFTDLSSDVRKLCASLTK